LDGRDDILSSLACPRLNLFALGKNKIKPGCTRMAKINSLVTKEIIKKVVMLSIRGEV
jgi:hypothetical protein